MGIQEDPVLQRREEQRQSMPISHTVTNPPSSTKEKFADENDFKDLMKKCNKLLMLGKARETLDSTSSSNRVENRFGEIAGQHEAGHRKNQDIRKIGGEES
uniref:Gag-pol polyprotein n=1 Tax=Caenorhabditis tropicalis TaxID=1561998 RepID=A0A1I7V3W8_9PELO